MNDGLVFFALGEKAYRVLAAVLPNYRSVVRGVVVGRDAGVQADFATEILALCGRYGLECVERRDYLKGSSFSYAYAIAIGWRWLIAAPSEKLIVLHDSLLPKYRGFAPLVNSLINGEGQIGVTAVFGAPEYDRGEILGQKALPVEYPIKIHEAIQKISDAYIEVAMAIVDKIAAGQNLVGVPQSERDATYSVWRDELDYSINWGKDAVEVARFIDSVGFPYEGARSLLDGTAIRISDASPVADVVVEDRASAIGKVLFVVDACPVVICGSGLLEVRAATSLSGESVLPLKKFRSRFS